MKLVYLINARIPTEKAHGYQVVKMCEAFSQLGIETELWFPTRVNPVEDDLFSFYQIESTFKTRTISCPDPIARLGFLGRFSFWLQNFFFVFALLFTRLGRDSIVYSRSPEVIWLFGLRGFRTVFEVHAIPKSKQFFYRLALRRANKIVALTRSIKKLLIDLGVVESKIIVAPDAVDLKTFSSNLGREEARSLIGLTSTEPVVGYFGRFRTMGVKKGLDVILEALVKISHPINLVARGGSEEDLIYYADFAWHLSLAHKVQLGGLVTRDKIALYQKACDILLMPFPYTEHYAYYMSPLKMFEYMASQRPIIASDLPSVREILNESNAILIPPDNPTALAEAITHLLAHPAIGEKLAAQAYRDVQNYTWDKRAGRVIEFIRNKK